MYIHPYSSLIKAIIATSTSAILAGCGGGGGGGGGATQVQTEITPASVSNTINTVANTAVNCSNTGTSPAPVISGVHISANKQLQDLLAAARSIEKDTKLRATGSKTGSCAGDPGEVTVTSNHSKGTTSYSMLFNNYCTAGVDGDSIYSGELLSKEVGTPSDFGPVISALEARTPANQPLSIEQRSNGTGLKSGTNETLLLTIDNARTVYGAPATWSPGLPTESKPDKLQASRIVLKISSTNEVYEARNIAIERFGSLTDATIKATAGSYINAKGEAAAISSEPLKVNLETGELVSGTVTLKGRADSVAEIKAGTTTRTFDVSVNGTPVTAQLDCANGDAPAKETLAALLSSLPIY